MKAREYLEQMRSVQEDLEQDASTLGSEVKGLESYYVYDFVVNPRNLTDHIEDLFGKEKEL